MSHWKQFLDEAGEGKLWKVATYMKSQEAWGCTPAMHVGANELTENKEKVQAFLETFSQPRHPWNSHGSLSLS